jgi:hypothetical protein
MKEILQRFIYALKYNKSRYSWNVFILDVSDILKGKNIKS